MTNPKVAIKTGSLRPRNKDAAIRSIFNAEFYLRTTGREATSADKAFAHYKSTGQAAGASPSPLFDIAHYRSQLRGRRIENPVAHYLDEGWKLGLSPHPLFDHDFYVAHAGSIPDGWTPLGHYLEFGWKLGLTPHPLFDPEYYCMASDLDPHAQDPLSHYLMQDSFEAAPHYLFSDSMYLASQAGAPDYRGEAPLTHYVLHGHRRAIPCHPLFDAGHYEAELRKLAAASGEDDLVKSYDGANPLRHYVEKGVHLGLSPTPYFDAHHLRGQVSVPADTDPLRHYLTPEVYAVASPHPGIDLAFYAQQARMSPAETPAILHLMATPQQQRVSPHPFFDPVQYLAASPDLRDPGLCPIMHFLSHGIREDRAPNAIFSADYVRRSAPDLSFSDISALQHYLTARGHERMRVVFVSHDASLTGAPGTVLRLMEDFAHLPAVECIGIVARGGPRLADFKRAGHIIVPGAPFYSTTAEQRQLVVDGILSATRGNPPIAAVVNSAESRLMGEALAKAGIPVITLVHEAADLYPEGAFETISENASRIVFGSQYVFDRALAAIPLPKEQAEVRGQGLQQDHVGRMPRDLARRLVLDELDLPDDTFLVLGCGTIDYRKGVDFFVASALDLLSRPGTEKACFVWIGESHDTHSTLHSFIANEIRTRDRNGRVRFIGPRADVEPYFVGADAFLMTSRVDPFPCVAQEAMASGLPIVAFAEGGGTIEMIEGKAGVCVPMNETSAMADAVMDLLADPEKAKAMGEHGRRLIRTKWRAHDYFRYMAGQVALVSGIPEEALFEGIRAERDPSAVPVYFLFDEWRRSPLSSHTEKLVADLRAGDVDARILLTRGRFDPSADRPSVPHVHLQPADVAYDRGRWRTTPQEVVASIQKFAREQQPCILVVVQDEIAAAAAPALPHGTAGIVMVHGSSPSEIETVYATGSHLERLVATSQSGIDAMLELNPGWEGKSVLIPWSAAIPASKRSKKPTGPVVVRADLSDPQRAAELRSLVAHMHEAGMNNRVVVVSDRPPPGKLRAIAMKAGVSPSDVVVEPYDPALRTLLLDSSATVILGGDASSAALVLDAMAAGSIPIVFNADPACNESIEDGRNGFVLERAHAGDLLARLRTALSSEGRDLRINGTVQMRHNDVDTASAWRDVISGVADDITAGRTRRSMVKAVPPAPADVPLPGRYRSNPLLPLDA